MPEPKRDIAKDTKMVEEATKYDYVHARWSNPAARSECLAALPHYLTRTAAAESKVATMEADNAGLRKALTSLVSAITAVEDDIPDSALHIVYANEMSMARTVLDSDAGKATLAYIKGLEADNEAARGLLKEAREELDCGKCETVCMDTVDHNDCPKFLTATAIDAHLKGGEPPVSVALDCAKPGVTADGKCIGYQRSPDDDEPTERCRDCPQNQFYEAIDAHLKAGERK